MAWELIFLSVAEPVTNAADESDIRNLLTFLR